MRGFRMLAALLPVALAACGNAPFDVSHPPRWLTSLGSLLPSTPVETSELSSSCLQGNRMRIDSLCTAQIAVSSKVMRTAKLQLVDGEEAEIIFTAAGSNPAKVKATDKNPKTSIPIRKSGGSLLVTCDKCTLEWTR